MLITILSGGEKMRHRLLNDLLVDMPKAYCLAQPGVIYAIYDQRKGTDFQLDLSGVSSKFTVQWLNPRQGGDWQTGSVKSVKGGGIVDLGQAPDTLDQDWCCIISKM